MALMAMIRGLGLLFYILLRFRVWGLGIRVQGLGFRDEGLGFRAQGLVKCLGFRACGGPKQVSRSG